MHGSGNLVFVAAVDKDLCGCIEDELIWQGATVSDVQQPGKNAPPFRRVALSHFGTPPILSHFEAGEPETAP